MMNTNSRLLKPFALLLFSAMVAHSMLVAQEKTNAAYIPTDKNLDTQWVKSLYEKGEQKVYKGKELVHIAMPCGGIGAGQVEITGEGKLCFTESVYNQMQKANAGNGYSTGYQYLNPLGTESKVKNAFSVVIKQKWKEARQYRLNVEDFDNIEFIGEYPVAKIKYEKAETQLPIQINAEVFSPFVPLSVRNSANPVTVLKYTICNTSNEKLDVSLVGWLKNVDFPESSKVKQQNIFTKSKRFSTISLEMHALSNDSLLLKHPQLGGFSLGVLDPNADYSVKNSSIEEYIQGAKSSKTMYSSENAEGGALSSSVVLRPNETKEITFFISWYFPNYYEYGLQDRVKRQGTKGLQGHVYNKWFKNSFDVVEYMATNFEELYKDTKLFRDTYNDNTLPYWLANRITMPVSTLAAGNIAIWENGRMYAYEGIGFCIGTCGHVYNFVTAISKLFPELERSVRLMQDFNEDVGFAKSGRINFRGHDANKPDAPHAYASDAQSGYILKLYRDHLMSPDFSLLDSLWPKVKKAVAYQIFKDGLEAGLEPNGVMEGFQTFWDPMWYGPNPYNNALYLAALRAAEEMAKTKGEFDLAKRYHSLYVSGQQYMNDKMWNGEYYTHLYPSGFSGAIHSDNGVAKPGIIENNAAGFVDAFNANEPNYYLSKACDANQLFGQNWAQQLGLGNILPPEKCKTAAKSIFKYCWTPDIATVYDYEKPRHRILGASGEPAMVNAGWPDSNPLPFENTHDKTDVWTGLEYEAACDMINAGLMDEALISIRSIDDRYNGTNRNPWNEIEGSDHYSRAMHSWNILLSISGFTCDGPAAKIGFTPRLNPENFKSFFSAAEGWGSFEQIRSGKSQTERIELKYGALNLKTLAFDFPNDWAPEKINVKVNGDKVVKCTFIVKGNRVNIELSQAQRLIAGQSLQIELTK